MIRKRTLGVHRRVFAESTIEPFREKSQGRIQGRIVVVLILVLKKRCSEQPAVDY